jgi:hypothetical protein
MEVEAFKQIAPTTVAQERVLEIAKAEITPLLSIENIHPLSNIIAMRMTKLKFELRQWNADATDQAKLLVFRAKFYFLFNRILAWLAELAKLNYNECRALAQQWQKNPNANELLRGRRRNRTSPSRQGSHECLTNRTPAEPRRLNFYMTTPRLDRPRPAVRSGGRAAHWARLASRRRERKAHWRPLARHWRPSPTTPRSRG